MRMSAARLTGMEKCWVTLGSTGAWKAAASMVTKVANSRAMKPTQGLAILLFIGAHSICQERCGLRRQLRLPVHAIDVRPAIDKEGIAGDIAAIIAAEEDRDRADVFQRVTDPPHGVGLG